MLDEREGFKLWELPSVVTDAAVADYLLLMLRCLHRCNIPPVYDDDVYTQHRVGACAECG